MDSSSKQDTNKLFRYPGVLCTLCTALYTCAQRAERVMHMRNYRGGAICYAQYVFAAARAYFHHASRCAPCQYTTDEYRTFRESWSKSRNPVYLRIGFVLCELIGRREASKLEASIASVDPRGREFRVPLKVYRYKDRVI